MTSWHMTIRGQAPLYKQDNKQGLKCTGTKSDDMHRLHLPFLYGGYY